MHDHSRRPVLALLAAVILVASLAVGPSAAQDTQYWSDGFGTQARLLGGIMIGSDQDISAVYYNPGGVALADSLQFLISLNALRYTSIGFSLSSAPAIPSSTGWSALSNMFGGTIPIGGRDSRNRLAYSILTRQYFNFGAQLRALPLDSFTPLPPPPGTVGIGNILVQQALAESWIGITWAHATPSRWGYGASLFTAVRNQTWGQTASAQVVSGNGSTALALREYDFSYTSWAMLLKLGVEYEAKNWSAGVTLTTPRLDLFGGADVGATKSYVDQGVVGPPGSSQIATSYQDNLTTTYHSPLSVGFGYSYHWRNSQLNFSTEWFNAVPEYTIIPGTPVTAQSGSDTLTMQLTTQARALWNWGVGYQNHFAQHWTMYAAYRTDLSSAPPGSQPAGTIVNYDLYHANVGAQAIIGRASIILGLDIAWGSKDEIPIGQPPPGLPAVPTIDETFNSVTGAVGFKFTF